MGVTNWICVGRGRLAGAPVCMPRALLAQRCAPQSSTAFHCTGPCRNRGSPGRPFAAQAPAVKRHSNCCAAGRGSKRPARRRRACGAREQGRARAARGGAAGAAGAMAAPEEEEGGTSYYAVLNVPREATTEEIKVRSCAGDLLGRALRKRAATETRVPARACRPAPRPQTPRGPPPRARPRSQRAYRQLASVFHPDKHASDELRAQAQEAFSRLQVGAAGAWHVCACAKICCACV